MLDIFHVTIFQYLYIILDILLYHIPICVLYYFDIIVPAWLGAYKTNAMLAKIQ